MTMGKMKYKFAGAHADQVTGRVRYVWEAAIPGDSRSSVITCDRGWFWRPRTSKVQTEHKAARTQ